jgi:hypothetical protein
MSMDFVYEHLKNNVSVIGLSGTAGSGKDYIAQNYFIKPRGFFDVSLSWHFKVSVVAKEEATYEEVFDTKPPEVRKLLQSLGTELGRNVFGEDIWVKHTFVWMALMNKNWGINKFIIPDIRYPNELTNIQNVGGVVYRVISDKRHRELETSTLQHSSEISLTDDMDIYDGIIYNYFGNDHDKILHSQVDSIMEKLNAKMAKMG